MTKFNYTNRKSEGVKLGQIVAKDLRKRIKPQARTDAHRESALVELHVEGKTLTDAGITELCEGLNEALAHRLDGTVATTRLQVLQLANNDLTAACLFSLSQSILAAADDLEDIDLSNNRIIITSDDHARDWERLLYSIGQCKILQRLNLSQNDLSNPKAFEAFARVGLRQFEQQEAEWSMPESNGVSSAIEEDLAQELDTLAVVHQNMPKASPPSRKSSVAARRRLTLLGIRTIILSDTRMTDAGALFLSYTIAKHTWIQSEKPFDESSLTSKQSKLGLDAPGIIYLPNQSLESDGLKLMKHAASVQYDPFDVTSQLLENRQTGTPITPATRKSSTSSHFRKESHDSTLGRSGMQRAPVSVVNELVSLQKRAQRTIIENQGPHAIALWHAALKILAYARNILVDTVNFPSLRSSPERQGALYSSYFAQPETPNQEKDKEKSPLRRLSASELSSWPQLPTPPAPTPQQQPTSYAAKLVISTAATVAVPSTPQVFRHPRATREGSASAQSSSPSSQSSSHQDKRRKSSNTGRIPIQSQLHSSPGRNGSSEACDSSKSRSGSCVPSDPSTMIGPLPLRAWIRILRTLADPESVLSERQVEAVISYARDRRTLAAEREIIGKPDAVQLWKVLEGCGCLSYE